MRERPSQTEIGFQMCEVPSDLMVIQKLWLDSILSQTAIDIMESGAHSLNRSFSVSDYHQLE